MRLTLCASLAVLAAAALPASASAGTLSGTVRTDADASPVASFQVELYTPLTQVKVDQTCTSAAGTYSLDPPNGTYLVRFAGAGTCGGERKYAPEWFRNRYSVLNAEPVAVTDAGVSAVDASLAGHAQFKGTVTREDNGAAIQNVAVDVLDIALKPIGRACSAADGTYTVVELVPGPHVVRYRADGSCGAVDPYVEQFYNGVDTVNAASAVDAGVDEVRENLNASLRLPAPKHPLSLAPMGTGTGRILAGDLNCTALCTGRVEGGAIVQVTAIADAGSTFTGWGGACTGTGACALVMGGPATVNAAFTRNATATPDPTPTATPTGGTGSTPQPGTPGNPAPGGSKATCKVTPTAKTKGGRLKATIRCDRRATLTLTGAVKVARKTLKLKATRVTAATRTVSLKLPSAARSALRAKQAVSATLTLVAKTTGGEAKTTAKVKKLR